MVAGACTCSRQPMQRNIHTKLDRPGEVEAEDVLKIDITGNCFRGTGTLGLQP